MSLNENAADAATSETPGAWREEQARAKVNLRLRIFPPGPDGYHPLETIFCRIDLADRVRLRMREKSGVKLVTTGDVAVPLGAENLAVQAATQYLNKAATGVGVEIELHKHIPVGAGLGGGSSDAAAVLRLLSTQVELPGGRPALLRLAAELGADVSFFLANRPYAVGWGRGERILLPGPPERRPLLLLCPRVQSSTADAYAAWDREKAASGAVEPLMLAPSDLASWVQLKSLAVNDFEPVMYARYPKLRELQALLAATAAEIALLAGSGSAVFGVYRNVEERDEAAHGLEAEMGKEAVRMISAAGPV